MRQYGTGQGNYRLIDAALYSIMGTARLNGIDLKTYLTAVLKRINGTPINQVEQLLAWNIDLNQSEVDETVLGVMCQRLQKVYGDCTMQGNELSPESILDAALVLAANRHWEAVRLHDVALHMNVSLVDLHAHIDEKEDLVDLLWDRADKHMLDTCKGTDFAINDFPAQFERCVMTWLDCLAPYRNTVFQMIQVRLEPGHMHIQLPTLFRISRTVQWVRELCGRDATFLKRASEEVVLTTVFVKTASFWLTDKSQEANRTREHLSRITRQAVRLGQLWPDNT